MPPSAESLPPDVNDMALRPAVQLDRWERSPGHRSRGARWIGWRARALVAAALIGCVGMLLLIRTLAAIPALPVSLQANDAGALLVVDATGATQRVSAIVDKGGRSTPIDAVLLQRSARWLVDDGQRARQASQHDILARTLASGTVRLTLADGQTMALNARPHGVAGLGAMFWFCATLALLLYLVTMVVLLARPEVRNALYAAMALAQVGNLLFLAAESLPALGLPAGFMRWDHDLRTGLDLVTAAALVHATGLHPRRLPGCGSRAAAVWLAILALLAAQQAGLLANTWWWTQSVAIACGLAAVAQLAWMQRAIPHPLAAVMWRLCALSVGTLLLLTLSIAALSPQTGLQGQAVAIGSAVWVIFLASMLLLLPFMARTQQLMREFALLAGVSTLATSLDLLFVALFSLSNFTSLTLALFISLGLYAGLRQWLLNQVLARERITTERMFEHLYRMVRELQSKPHDVDKHLTRLLREMFDPLEVTQLARRSSRSRVVGDGASLLVPVPQLTNTAAPSVIALGFAGRGGRMFTADDARLADLVVDQLSRAAALDRAVERGRHEERVRIAQDLHDDIGARLLTLMYRAPTREMEDYLRHTLKDLKTLTRGLAATDHRLSHAVAEWKADVAQRLAAGGCEVTWSFDIDRDFELGVVQWSALTRILRELVSNVLAHAHATHVDIDARLERGVLTLSVADNGRGRDPEAWSHGLGLGGVRKRVKQLGGTVHWRELDGQGIACIAVIPKLEPAAA